MLFTIGYDPVLYYGGDGDVPIQQRHIERMVRNDRVKAMIVAAVDPNSLINSLKPAKESKIPVISFDKLIMYSDAVSYYVGFDNVKTGELQAKSIISKLRLDARTADNPAYLELCGGAAKDMPCEAAHNSFLSMILPYIDDGRLVVRSGEFFKAMCQVDDGSSDKALKRMEKLIKDQNYGPLAQKLDAVYCATDTIADGVVTALKKAGYSLTTMPFITGRDATLSQLKGIMKGERGSTIFRDPAKLNCAAAQIVDSVLSGQLPNFNDLTSYNNGVFPMKSVVCDPVLVDENNIKKLFPDLK